MLDFGAWARPSIFASRRIAAGPLRPSSQAPSTSGAGSRLRQATMPSPRSSKKAGAARRASWSAGRAERRCRSLPKADPVRLLSAAILAAFFLAQGRTWRSIRPSSGRHPVVGIDGRSWRTGKGCETGRRRPNARHARQPTTLSGSCSGPSTGKPEFAELILVSVRALASSSPGLLTLDAA